MKLIVKLVFCISLADFWANFFAAFGEPANGSGACWIQALATNYFYTASVLWTTSVCYVLYDLVFNGKVRLNFTQLSTICWSIPFVVTLLPLVSVTYGRADGEPGWCYLMLYSKSPNWELIFWAFITFYIWL